MVADELWGFWLIIVVGGFVHYKVALLLGKIAHAGLNFRILYFILFVSIFILALA